MMGASNQVPQKKEVEKLASAASPCIDVCQIDKRNGLCTGCFRSLDEIAAWSGATNDERLGILAAVERRRADFDPSGNASGGELTGNCER